MSAFNNFNQLINSKAVKTGLLMLGMAQLPNETPVQAQDIATASIDRESLAPTKKVGGLFPKYPAGKSSREKKEVLPTESIAVVDPSLRTTETPISSRLGKFLKDNPGSDEYFQENRQGKAPQRIGTQQYEQAVFIKDELDKAMNGMISLQARKVPFRSVEFQQALKESNELVRELRRLTGDAPRVVAHTKLSPEENRKEWARESLRLEGTLELAAFRVQDERVKEVSRSKQFQERPTTPDPTPTVLEKPDTRLAVATTPLSDVTRGEILTDAYPPSEKLLTATIAAIPVPHIEKTRKAALHDEVYETVIIDGNIPRMLARAVTAERNNLLDHVRGTALEIPISPALRKFLDDYPGMAHHFVIPRGSRGVDFIGKSEFNDAERALNEYEHLNEVLLNLHKNKISPNHAQITQMSSLTVTISTLLGIHPDAIFVTSSPQEKRREYRDDGKYYRSNNNYSSRMSGDGRGFNNFMRAYKEPLNPLPNAELRTRFTEDMVRLRDSVEQAAYRAQDKHLFFVEKFELTETDSWYTGIMLNDKLRGSSFEQAVIHMAREGRNHPIVQKFQSERQERMETARAQLRAEQLERDMAHERKLQNAYDIDSSSGMGERKLLPQQIYDRISRERAFKGLNVDPKQYRRSRY